jgi:glutaconate CoA-transferase subunit A
VESKEIATRAHSTRIPGFLVDHVIEAPFGAHPTSHVPRYAQDAWEILRYQQAAAGDEEGYQAYLTQLREETESDYRARVLGDDRDRVLTALAQAGPTLEASDV